MDEVFSDTWDNDPLAKVRYRVFLGHDGGVNTCCFLKDGNDDQYAVSGGDDKTIRIWDTDEKSEKKKLLGHRDEVSCVRSSSDGTKIISTALDKSMIVWDMHSGQPMFQSSHDGMAMSCDFSYDDKYMLSTTDLENAVYIWDLRQQDAIKIMKYHTSTVTGCKFAPSSYSFCTTSMDMTARVVNMQDYRDNMDPHCVLTLRGHSSMISSCNFSFDERYICTGSWDKSVIIWDVNAGSYRSSAPLVLEKEHHGCVSSCSFMQNGNSVLSGSYEGNMIIWDAELACKKLILAGHTDWVTDCHFSKEEKRVVSSSKDGSVRYWKVENYECLPFVMLNQENSNRLMQCQDCGKQYAVQSSASDDVQRGHPKPTTLFRRCVFCRQKIQEEEDKFE